MNNEALDKVKNYLKTLIKTNTEYLKSISRV